MVASSSWTLRLHPSCLLVLGLTLVLSGAYRLERDDEEYLATALTTSSTTQTPCSISTTWLWGTPYLQYGSTTYYISDVKKLQAQQRASMNSCLLPIIKSMSDTSLKVQQFAVQLCLEFVAPFTAQPKLALRAAQDLWRLFCTQKWAEAQAAAKALAPAAPFEDVVQHLVDSALIDGSALVRSETVQTLQCLAPTSAVAKEAWDGLDRLSRRSFESFLTAVRGTAAAASTEQLASRYQDGTDWVDIQTLMSTQCDTDSLWLPEPPLRIWQKREAPFVPLPASVKGEPATTKACARICATATPLVMRYMSYNETARQRFQATLKLQNGWNTRRLDTFDDYCAGFAVDAGKCYLLRVHCKNAFYGSKPQVASSDSYLLPAKFMRLTGAASFCANHWTKMSIGKGAAEDPLLVQACQQAVFKAGGGDKTSTADQFPKFLCAEECSALVRRMRGIVDRTGFKAEVADFKKLEDFHGDLKFNTEFQYGEPCTKHVVQLVEHTNLKCCALSCGWDAPSKSCKGISLLPRAGLERWWLECCHTGAVLFLSDRDRMCASAEPIVRAGLSSGDAILAAPELPARDEAEAFAVGQAVDDPVTVTSASRPALLEVGLAGSESGSAAAGVAAGAGADSLSPCRLSCSWDWSFENSLIQCSAPALLAWFAPVSSQVCTTAVATMQTASPHECGEKALAAATATSSTIVVKYASWQLLAGQKVGTCRHFDGRCDRSWILMAGQKKSKMDNVTSVIWRSVIR